MNIDRLVTSSTTIKWVQKSDFPYLFIKEVRIIWVEEVQKWIIDYINHVNFRSSLRLGYTKSTTSQSLTRTFERLTGAIMFIERQNLKAKVVIFFDKSEVESVDEE